MTDAKEPKEKLLGKRFFSFTGDNGEKLEFTTEVCVNRNGLFYMNIPDELETTASRMEPQWHDSRENRVCLSRQRKFLRIDCPALQPLLDFIKAVALDHLKCEVKIERVIVYSLETKVAYCKGASGKLYANGTAQIEAGDGNQHGNCNWNGSLLDSSNGGTYHYSIGIYASVMQKTSYTRPSGTVVKYEHTRADERDDEKEPWHNQLNSFCRFYSPIRHFNLDKEYKEMPYTEEAARFFYETLIGICTLADRLETFFGSKEHIERAIATRTMLLLNEGPRDKM